VTLSHTEVKDLYDKYFGADKSFSQYNVNFPDGVNSLDPLVLLELINGENTVGQRAAIAAQLITGKKVEIYEGEKKVKGFTFNGTGSLSLLFTDEPYLLQVLIDYGYALVLKKLTPPSPVSNEEVVVKQ
jgi:hypothetical protein